MGTSTPAQFNNTCMSFAVNMLTNKYSTHVSSGLRGLCFFYYLIPISTKDVDEILEGQKGSTCLKLFSLTGMGIRRDLL